MGARTHGPTPIPPCAQQRLGPSLVGALLDDDSAGLPPPSATWIRMDRAPPQDDSRVRSNHRLPCPPQSEGPRTHGAHVRWLGTHCPVLWGRRRAGAGQARQGELLRDSLSPVLAMGRGVAMKARCATLCLRRRARHDAQESCIFRWERIWVDSSCLEM